MKQSKNMGNDAPSVGIAIQALVYRSPICCKSTNAISPEDEISQTILRPFHVHQCRICETKEK